MIIDTATLLIPLYNWAMESQRPDAMLTDDLAVKMVSQVACDFLRLRLHGYDEVAVKSDPAHAAPLSLDAPFSAFG